MATHKRVNKKTPSGGDYSEIYYMNDNFEVVDETEATLCKILECKANGDLIFETIGFVKRDKTNL